MYSTYRTLKKPTEISLDAILSSSGAVTVRLEFGDGDEDEAFAILLSDEQLRGLQALIRGHLELQKQGG